MKQGYHIHTYIGLGLVHTAPAHGVEDFNLCRAHHIDLIDCGKSFRNDMKHH
jgi:isoleucyl-tRNA synthetase